MFNIDKRLCSSCGLCADVCCFEAINQVGVYIINKEKCIGCGVCQESCPSDAIKEIKKIEQ